MKYFLFWALTAMLSGCSKPQVYLFGRYLKSDSIEKIEQRLSEQGFEVSTNKHLFPSRTKSSTLVHSVTIEQTQIDRILSELKSQGYSDVNPQVYAATGKQFFSGDAFGLYLLPKDWRGEASFLEASRGQDLPDEIETNFDCTTRRTMQLLPEGNLKLEKAAWDSELGDYKVEEFSGEWSLSNTILIVELGNGQKQYFEKSTKEFNEGRYIHKVTQFTPTSLNPEESELKCVFEANFLELVESL